MGEWVRLVADYGPWGLSAAVLFLVWRVLRSGPARTASHLVSTEMRRRYEDYLRRRGVSDADVRRLLDDRHDPPPAPPV